MYCFSIPNKVSNHDFPREKKRSSCMIVSARIFYCCSCLYSIKMKTELRKKDRNNR